MTSPTPPSPESAEPVLDLESQLDALLAQIEQSEPGILQPSPASSTPAPPQAVTPVASSSTTSSAEDDSAAADVLDDELSFSPEDFIAPSDPLPRTATPQASPAAADNSTDITATTAAASAASASSVVHEQSQEQAQASADDHDELGLDLAAQIQQLLDHARDDERPAAAATSAAPAASQGLVPENLTSEDLAPAAPAAAQASQAAMTLEDIDHMLSEEAEDAVSGEFETPTQVLAETAAPASDTTSNQDASHAEADDLVEGSFQATQDILPSSASTTASSATPPHASQPAAPSSSTTKQEQPLTPAAAAVARELDEQPENDPVRRSRIAPELDIHESPHHHAGSRFALLTTLLSQLPQALRHLCAFISRPLASATPQARDMVGYVGLITLFWGSVTVAVKIFFATNN